MNRVAPLVEALTEIVNVGAEAFAFFKRDVSGFAGELERGFRLAQLGAQFIL